MPEDIHALLHYLTIPAFAVMPSKSNDRVEAQDGAFLICGMKLLNYEISDNPGTLGRVYYNFDPIDKIVPEKIINFFIQNKELFSKVHEIQKIRNRESVLGDIIPIINELNIIDKREVDIEKLVYSLKDDMDNELEKSIKQVDLEGDEILNLLNNNFPPKISKIFDEIINKRKEIIREKTGLSFDPFLRTYPIQIDDTEIQRVTLEQSSKKENDIFDIKKTAAIELNSINPINLIA
jgi:hypothetical protein